MNNFVRLFYGIMLFCSILNSHLFEVSLNEVFLPTYFVSIFLRPFRNEKWFHCLDCMVLSVYVEVVGRRYRNVCIMTREGVGRRTDADNYNTIYNVQFTVCVWNSFLSIFFSIINMPSTYMFFTIIRWMTGFDYKQFLDMRLFNSKFVLST